MIIFPAIDLRGGRCVRLRQGRLQEETLFSDDPLAVAQHWAEEGAEWLHVVNLDGAFGIGSFNISAIQEIIAAVDLPIQLGGGLRDLASIEEALSWGIERAILGTAAVRNPTLVAEAVESFGAERIVIGIDVREGKVAIHGWREVSAVEPLKLALRMRGVGVRRIVYTDVARDGTLAGPNLAAVREMAQRTGLKVIASGGISSLDDIRRLKELEPCGVEGGIVGMALYTGAISLAEAIKELKRC